MPSLVYMIFSVCDVRNGFWHVELDEETGKLRIFATPVGRYRLTRVPFGLAPAPEIFHRKFDHIILLLQNIARIADDILEWEEGENPKDAVRKHDSHQHTLIRAMEEGSVKLHPDKLKLRISEVLFAGHSLAANGLTADSEKVVAIMRM